MPRAAHLIYLHGFTSSPASSKARRFRDETARLGMGFSCPDFNQPEFETLSVTRMLEHTAAAIDAAGSGPVALVGSSLGAFVAVLSAAGALRPVAPRPVDRLILLAPALDFGGNRLQSLGDHGIAEWRARGSLSVFHHASGAYRDVGFQLYEDAARYDAWHARFQIPALVFQGRRDATVDPSMVERWVSARPGVVLRMLDDGHQLAESVDAIWEESARWLA